MLLEEAVPRCCVDLVLVDRSQEPKEDIIVVFREVPIGIAHVCYCICMATRSWLCACPVLSSRVCCAFLLEVRPHQSSRPQALGIWRLQDSTLMADLHMLCGKTHPGHEQPAKRHPVSSICDLSLVR